MNAAVFSFVKVSKDTAIASARIAQFVATLLDLPLIDNASIADSRWNLLILVNGAFSFCSCRDDVAKAVRRADRILWIQNDYAIYPPIADGIAESTFRKAFRIRRRRHLPDMDLWTTIRRNVEMTPFSEYVNWNMLTALDEPMRVRRTVPDDLFYYGAFRTNRARTFDRYFRSRKTPLVLSSASKKFGVQYPHATMLGAMTRDAFYRELNRHGFGLYIEDPRSHKEFHSPANRFYEMLSAGLPMLFEPDSVGMLGEAGFDVSPYVVENSREIRSQFGDRRTIGRTQQREWWSDFVPRLKHNVLRKYRRYVSTHFGAR